MIPIDRDRNAAYYQAHKDAKLAYKAAYYQAHREEILAGAAVYGADHRDAILEKHRQKRAKFREWLQVLRKVSGCADCEAPDGRLEHHHVDPATKRYVVSGMYACSLCTLEEELEKCVVLCDSCHKKRHVAMRLTQNTMETLL